MAKVGGFNTGTGTGSLSVTGVGFEPVAVVFWWSGATGSSDGDQANTDIDRGVGFALSSTERRAASLTDVDSAATMDVSRRTSESHCILFSTGDIDLASMDTDGFTLDREVGAGADYRVTYMALTAEEAASAYVGSVQVGQVDQAGVSFRPEALVFLGTGVTSNEHHLSFGVATDHRQLRQYAASGRHRDASAGSVTRSALRAAVWSDGLTDEVAVDAFHGDGFSFDAAPSSVNASFDTGYYLALAGGEYDLGFVTLPTTAGQYALGLGHDFTPAAVLAFSAEMSVDNFTVDSIWSMGAATSASAREAQAGYSEDGQTASDCHVYLESDQVDVGYAANASLDALTDLVGLHSNGASFVADDAPASGYDVVYFLVAAASEPVVGGTVAVVVEQLAAGASVVITPERDSDWILQSISSDHWIGTAPEQNPEVTVEFRDDSGLESKVLEGSVANAMWWKRGGIWFPGRLSLKLTNENAAAADIVVTLVRQT